MIWRQMKLYPSYKYIQHQFKVVQSQFYNFAVKLSGGWTSWCAADEKTLPDGWWDRPMTCHVHTPCPHWPRPLDYSCISSCAVSCPPNIPFSPLFVAIHLFCCLFYLGNKMRFALAFLILVLVAVVNAQQVAPKNDERSFFGTSTPFILIYI